MLVLELDSADWGSGFAVAVLVLSLSLSLSEVEEGAVGTWGCISGAIVYCLGTSCVYVMFVGYCLAHAG